MKIIKFNLRVIFLFLLCFSWFNANSIHAYNLRQYKTKDGLSNAVVTTIYQDHNGVMWFGTDNGLNAFDGIKFSNIQSTEDKTYLGGQAIHDIFEVEDHVFWVLTGEGLSRINLVERTIKTFNELGPNIKIARNDAYDVYVVSENDYLYYYQAKEETFKKIPVDHLTSENIINMFVDRDNVLWIVMEEGIRSIRMERKGADVKLINQSMFKHQEPILWCFYEEGSIYFVDDVFTLYEYNLSDKTKYYIQDLGTSVNRNGGISSIIKHNGDFYIGFFSGGLMHIKNMPDRKSSYQIDEISFRSGILSLANDKHQDIVWVGTDGQGVYMLFNESSVFNTVLSGNLTYPVNTPITALFKDVNQTLWVGTRGNGIVNIHGYNPEHGSGTHSESFLPYVTSLSSKVISTFAPSNKNLFWIGTENGVDYYSFGERKIKNIHIMADGKPVRNVRSICELNDSVLWIATAGEGVVKVVLAGTSDSPVVAAAQRFYAGNGSKAANRFTVAYKENAGTVWFGTQDSGAYKVDSSNGKMENIRLVDDERLPQNDIYFIVINNEGYWFATANGLVRMKDSKTTIFDENNGFNYKTVRSILDDNKGNLWLSTDYGIVKFDMKQQTFHLCKQSEEKAIKEFGIGVCFNDSVSHLLFFGGKEGFTVINESNYTHQSYMPRIIFNGLSVFGKRCNIYDYLIIKKKAADIICLESDQNVFAVSFVASDYIDGQDFTYFYKLGSEGDNWVDNGSSNTVSFTYLASGKYTLFVKYRNTVTGEESQVYSVIIHILPRWYQTWWAYLIYIFVLALVVYVLRYLYRRYMARREAELVVGIEQNFSRLKLDFFVRMSNEFCTPLSLIYCSSDKILSDPEANENIRSYATLIHTNVERLNGFINDINDLRVLEAGDRKPKFLSLPVSELADTIAGLFIEQAEERKINYQIKISNGLFWVSDSYYLCRLIGNLLGNAFIHVDERGVVSVELLIRDAHLRLEFTYTADIISGRGDDAIENDFTYGRAIHLLEQESRSSLSTFDDRLMAITCGIVQELRGSIQIEQTKEGRVIYTVMLPEIQVEEMVEDTDETNEVYKDISSIRLPKKNEPNSVLKLEHMAGKRAILFADSDYGMFNALSILLGDTYNISFVSDEKKSIELLHSGKYDLLISKTDTPLISGIELVRSVKADAALSHVSCVLLASDNGEKEKNEALEVGVDLYMTRPLDLEKLVKEISSLTRRQKVQEHLEPEERKPFKLEDERFASREEKVFFEKILHSIEKNIKNTGLSVEMISGELACTTQELYSRLRGITGKTPNEIISEYRLYVAEYLLESTNLSVEDIMIGIGFTDRANFFKLFVQRYGISPKDYRRMKRKMLLKK